MSADRSPALVIRFPPGTPLGPRDALVALLADHGLVAIQEDDVTAARTWTAHFASRAGRDAAAAAIPTVPDLRGLGLEPVEIEDEDWARRTQADLPAIRIGRVIVAPPWDLPPGAGGAASPPPEVPGRSAATAREIVILIEPSRGFGTGHHQSTRLCIALLQARDLSGRTAIDAGTGSGVLAILAAKLGAAAVSAIDVDPDAVDNARENIERNGVAGTVEAHVRDLTGSRLPPADVVVANLTGTHLARHASALASFVRPAGELIVAGFTGGERVLVTEAFRPGFEIIETAEEEGWEAMVMTRGSGFRVQRSAFDPGSAFSAEA